MYSKKMHNNSKFIFKNKTRAACNYAVSRILATPVLYDYTFDKNNC